MCSVLFGFIVVFVAVLVLSMVSVSTAADHSFLSSYSEGCGLLDATLVHWAGVCVCVCVCVHVCRAW